MFRIPRACLASVFAASAFTTLLNSQNVPQPLPVLASTHSTAVASRPFALSPARIGVPYAHALETNRRAQFEKAGGNADWLTVSPDGVLTGTPPEGSAQEAVITIYAYALNDAGNREPEAPLVRSFAVAVQPNDCLSAGAGSLAWCDDPPPGRDGLRPSKEERFAFELQGIETSRESLEDKRQADFVQDCNWHSGCILQFDRLGGPITRFGYYSPKAHRILWFIDFPGKGMKDDIIKQDDILNAINGSKVFLSGSVILRRDVKQCKFWAWSVVTETEDSSNNLIYGPPDLSSFCTASKTALIILPVHIIWASVYGRPANTNDPSWKPTGTPPQAHACWTGEELSGPPEAQGIKPCDTAPTIDPDPKAYSDQNPDPILKFWYWSPVRFLSNRFAQPGVSQGSISIAPVAPSGKGTFDIQLYLSSLLGPGWLGFQGMYEYDRNQADSFNSLTAAATYDFRLFQPEKDPRWWKEWGTGSKSIKCINTDEGKPDANSDCSPPVLGIRPAELSFKGGTEWSPDSFLYAMNKPNEQYLGRDSNIVFGATLRLPFVLSPRGGPQVLRLIRQLSWLTIVPVAGLEGGFRVVSHDIGTDTNCTIALPTHPCAPQPGQIFRQVAGADASIRFPYSYTHNFFGDRPLTLDYSYRERWLSFEEPWAFYPDLGKGQTAGSGQAAGERSYSRITFIAPISAYFNARATWQHGSLPPLYQYVGNLITFGLTFSNPGLSEH